MKRHFAAFAIIALCAELVTTWWQKELTAMDVAGGYYYERFRDMLVDRLIVWSVVFFGLSGAWALIGVLLRKRSSAKSAGNT
jgi:hypothetical protein